MQITVTSFTKYKPVTKTSTCFECRNAITKEYIQNMYQDKSFCSLTCYNDYIFDD